jgi:hypothetical protein
MEQLLVILSLLMGAYAIYVEKKNSPNLDRSLDNY